MARSKSASDCWMCPSLNCSAPRRLYSVAKGFCASSIGPQISAANAALLVHFIMARLKQYLQPKLDLPRIVGAGDLADTRRRRNIRPGILEVRVVRHVKKFRTKLRLDALGDRGVLEQAHVEDDLPGAE